jgi:hypothetical protein
MLYLALLSTLLAFTCLYVVLDVPLLGALLAFTSGSGEAHPSPYLSLLSDFFFPSPLYLFLYLPLLGAVIAFTYREVTWLY